MIFITVFVRPTASEKHLVTVGRWSTALLMLFSALFALVLSNALQAFQILLQIGAGTGLLFILRWFFGTALMPTVKSPPWSFLSLAIYFQVLHTRFGFSPIANDLQFLLSVGLTTLAWVAVTLLTAPSDMETLTHFVRKIQPGGPGWAKVREQMQAEEAHRQKLVYSHGNIVHRWWEPLPFIPLCFPPVILFTENGRQDCF